MDEGSPSSCAGHGMPCPYKTNERTGSRRNVLCEPRNLAGHDISCPYEDRRASDIKADGRGIAKFLRRAQQAAPLRNQRARRMVLGEPRIIAGRSPPRRTTPLRNLRANWIEADGQGIAKFARRA